MDKLEPNTEYAFRMNAFNRNGDGEFTEVRTIVTGGIGKSEAFTDLKLFSKL